MVASHNEDTVRFAIEKMKEIGISPEDKVICFGQLLGMCDYITMPLGKKIPFHMGNSTRISSILFYFLYTFRTKRELHFITRFFFSLIQVKLDTRPINTYHTVQCTKYCLIYHVVLKRIKAF